MKIKEIGRGVAFTTPLSSAPQYVHEVFEGKNAHAFEDGDKLGIKVNCAEDAGSLEGKVKYAIAVSLELAEAVPLDLFGDNIYEEVRNRLRVPVSIATNTSTR